MKKQLNKILKNKGIVDIEVVIAIGILLPILLYVTLTGYAYFMAQSQNIDLNFDAGRYVATSGCTVDKVSTMSKLTKFQSYKVTWTDGTTTTVVNEGTAGEITVSCTAGNKRGNEFAVYTKLKTGMNLSDWLSDITYRRGLYVLETGEKE